jgi:hypothetical protein
MRRKQLSPAIDRITTLAHEITDELGDIKSMQSRKRDKWHGTETGKAEAVLLAELIRHAGVIHTHVVLMRVKLNGGAR